MALEWRKDKNQSTLWLNVTEPATFGIHVVSTEALPATTDSMIVDLNKNRNPQMLISDT